MIPKHIERKDGSDNYRALALYVTDASIGKEPGEKTLYAWYAGGEAESFLDGLVEVEATQAMNTKSKTAKTYHLMVSFRPEDEDKLSAEILREIETMLAAALGFEDHQRHCGVHRNTSNIHLHVAYNAINPITFNRHSPYHDYIKLTNACRAIEQKCGLMVDRGMDDFAREEVQPNNKVQALEAQTGQESLFSYIQRHKADLMAGLDMAKDWNELHSTLLKRGLILKTKGNGLAIHDRYGKHAVKASDLDRSFSKAKLEARFGPFQIPATELFHTVNNDERYIAAPLHQEADRNGLYALFQKEMAERKRRLEEIRRESQDGYETIKGKWNQTRKKIRWLPMLRSDWLKVMDELKRKEQGELQRLRSNINDKRTAVRSEFPYTSWTKCLRHKAALGNETALAILRSRKEPIEPEKLIHVIPSSPYSQEYDKPQPSPRPKMPEQHGLPPNHQTLSAVIKMRDVLLTDDSAGESAKKLKYSIDAKGTIIFTLPDGGVIRDTGHALYSSAYGKKVLETAEKYALAKWGEISRNGNKFETAPSNPNERQVQDEPDRQLTR